jgi:hypothetical protein
MFAFRKWMRPIRWALLVLLIALHAVMNKPVWHLVCRIDIVGGSTGYHRYRLIQGAVDFFPEWCLIGTRSTAHWGWRLYDVTNQYVLEGVRGGALTLALFIAMISVGFQQVGRIRRAVAGDRYKEVMAWSLGVALFVHCVNFIAVSYYGQIIAVWYLNLAVIASLGAAVAQQGSVTARATLSAGRTRPRTPGRSAVAAPGGARADVPRRTAAMQRGRSAAGEPDVPTSRELH